MPPPEQAATQEAARPQPTQAERMQAAIDKGKALSGVPETEAKEPNGTGETDPEATAGEQSGDLPAGEDSEKAPVAADAAEGAKPNAAAEPKTKRSKEWADIERKQASIAKREREAARREEANTRERAELQKAQQQIVELNQLYDKDPAAFIERLKGRPGGLRDLFERAVAQEKTPPEEVRIQKLEKELAEEREWRKKREESEAKAKEEWDRAESERQEKIRHQNNYNIVHESIAELAKAGGYPNIAAVLKHKRASEYVTNDVYGRILAAWKDGAGEQRNIPDVLDDVEAELAVEAGSAPQVEPPARAAGAVQSAKPEAKPKRTPPTLTSAQASARASAGRELTGDARKAHFASMLRTRPE